MSKEDALLSIQKHTTSKIKSADDLFRISTLGFRGEALSSIASISNMKIQTKTADADEGFVLEIEEGKVKKQGPAACPAGTTVLVNDLFFNTPARKKHLNEISVELRHITEVIIRYALINPVGLKLEHNGKTVINCPENIDELGRIINIYGKDFGKQLIKIEEKTENAEISGYIGKPALTKSDKDGIMIYVNSRFIKNKAVSNAVYDAYHTLLGTQRFPVAILNIRIPEEKIDVNVHPTKIEVRIEKEHLVCSDVIDMIKQKLEKTELAPKMKSEAQQKFQRETDSKIKQKQEESKHRPLDTKASLQQEIKINDIHVEVPAYKILGVVHNTFIIIETKKGLRIVDLHAAHERILYEKFMSAIGKGSIKKQTLLQPVRVDVSADEAMLANDNVEIFDKYGMQIEGFGKNTVLIRTLPSVLGSQLDQKMFSDLISEIRKSKKTKSIDELKERMVITMACRAAEKAGDCLEMSEMQQLIKDLENCRQPYTCPHGRPTMIDYTITELEKSFNRIRSEKDAI
jgi:DNA mismatch repair protein MutL